MSAYLYDEAILKKLQQWFKGTNATLTGVNETQKMLSVLADKNNDTPIQLPLITISRNGGFTILNKQKQPMTYNALSLNKSYKTTVQLNAIPISIQYQIDVYTRYFQEADEYARNLIFNLINYPQMMVEIPYENADIQHMANIHLQSEIEDNSDIAERLISGQFYRWTITVDIDDAYLFDVKIRNNYHFVELSAQIDDAMPRELIATIDENGKITTY